MYGADAKDVNLETEGDIFKAGDTHKQLKNILKTSKPDYDDIGL